MSFKKILVALDHSPLSNDVFDQALAIAKSSQAHLMLLHCIPIESQVLTPYPSLYSEEMANFSQLIQERLEEQKKATQDWLSDFVELANAQGVEGEWDWKVGEPSHHIRDLAKGWNADLVVLGRRGLNGLAEMFLGSVSNYVVHHVPCSVLIVQQPQD